MKAARLGLASCTIGLGFAWMASGWAAVNDNPAFAAKGFQAKGFKVAEHYGPPYETQIKSLLEGGSATPLPGGKTQLSDGVTMRTFTESNTLQLTIKAPECLYDSAGQTASSPGPLRVETPEGKFLIEGEGFLWQQTNASLFISNRVHTILKSDALQAAPTTTVSTEPTGDQEPTHIFSDFFSYDSSASKGIYRHNVHVSNTNLTMSGGLLTVLIPRGERQLQNVTAEQNVTVDYWPKGVATLATHIRTEGQRADFASQTGLITISGGHPTWRAEPREGNGDQLIIDRTNQIFQANGHAWLQMPRQTFESSGFMAPPSNAAKNDTASTNGLIEVHCDTYELHTNWGVFRKNVRVIDRVDDQTRGQMNCGLMTLTFTGSNQLERLVAQNHVVIEQETNRFTAGNAVFTAADGILELTHNPTWQAGPRQGRGDVLRVKTQANELLAQGHAFMRLPAEEFATELAPTTTNQTVRRPPTGIGQFAEITSQEYTLRTNSASFRGKVHACHPRMEWLCDQLTVLSSADRAKPDSMLAETGVEFELENDDGQHVHGTANRAVYSFTVSETRTNDLLTLFGSPATLVTTNAIVRNERIIYDRLTSALATPGTNYHIEGVAPATKTNLFAPPKLKSIK